MGMCYNPVLVRDKPLGSPASVKRIYWLMCMVGGWVGGWGGGGAGGGGGGGGGGNASNRNASRDESVETGEMNLSKPGLNISKPEKITL